MIAQARFFKPALHVLASVSLLLGLASCEDKELVRKNEELRQRVAELQKKVDILKIEAGEDPGDQTQEIKRVSEELRKALAKLEELDGERDKLEAVHAAKEKEFREYQRKYPVE